MCYCFTTFYFKRNQVATSRFDAQLHRPTGGDLPVHVIVSQSDFPDCVLIELIEIDERRPHRLLQRKAGTAQIVDALFGQNGLFSARWMADADARAFAFFLP